MDLEEAEYNIIYDKVIDFRDTYSISDDDWVPCDESDVKEGDVIFIQYTPISQLNLYVHLPECGTVTNIGTYTYHSPTDDSIKEDINITITNHIGKSISLNKDYFSIYSRGYWTTILKYVRH
ncbi:MAG: hypothetical protein Gaeavirus3_6 [Gaeavirus sp.]|uniref:Uncharacterized protein n=1 Tax=Gaeavirus sp. TaxID=2487767 RepID=A0A3G4ZYH4_9VIRU|nr:MAG: hypothetical protein Gaeavirus3_6 [Gaeavirus sp.]